MSLKLALLLAAIAMDFAAGVYYERLIRVHHEDKITIATDTQELKRVTNDAQITSQEGQDYARAVAQAIAAPDPAPAVVCVRRYTVPLAAPATARSGADAGGGLPGGDRRPLPASTDGRADIAAPAALIGARANAQVRGLKDYITRVCLAN